MREAYIYAAARTPVGKHGGSLAGVRPDDLAAIPIKAVVERTKVDPQAIDDVILGCANQAGEDNRNVARMASLLAGFPTSVPGITLNRLCASGLSAVNTAFRAIKAGEGELMLAGGKPAVVSLDTDHNYGFSRFDPQTGAQTVIKNGLCQGKPDPKTNPPQRLEEVYLSPDGSLAYLMLYSGGFDQPGCAQLVDLSTDKVQWSAVPQEGQTWPSAWFAAEVAVTDEGVFFYEENSLSMIDAKTGTLRELFKEPRYREVTPLVSTPGHFAGCIAQHTAHGRAGIKDLAVMVEYQHHVQRVFQQGAKI